MNFKKGEVLFFNKPLGWTSFKVVGHARYHICRRIGVKKLKVGHAGTLDPLATGVMIVCTGKATKRIEEFQYHTKEYVATLRLGATTPSYDLEHEIDATYPTEHITRELVEEVLTHFIGAIDQVPPAFSACMVDGKRAYELARKGEEVELKAKQLVIDEIELLECRLDDPEPMIQIRVVCSKGTYIRALARDIGEALHSGAHLTGLIRTRVGDVRLEDCLNPEHFKEWIDGQEIENEEENKIALHPMKYRDESRLMVLHRNTGKIEHKMFKDVLDYFDDKDVFIFNDTKVFPARLYGNKEKTGARIEVFLLRELNEELRLWDVLVDPARKIRIGNKLYFGPDDSMVAEVIDNTTSRGRTLRFLYDGPHDEFKKALYSLGETPLPHSIINRPVEPEDAERFQSIFAKNEGAVTAPTASLHFSRELMKRLEIKGVDFAYITLHAGLGNFRDIDVEDLTKHKMDSEQMFVNEMAVKTVNRAKDNGRNVCAVGTTVMRAIESAVSTDGHLKEFEGWTNKFIFPPYEFTVANSMISNFHMPLSTLLMIVAAFGGYDQVMDAYHVALKEGYRFGTYGDAMLILDK